MLDNSFRTNTFQISAIKIFFNVIPVFFNNNNKVLLLKLYYNSKIFA